MTNQENEWKIEDREQQITLLMNALEFYFLSIREMMKSYNKFKDDVTPEENKFRQAYLQLLDSQYKVIGEWVLDTKKKETTK